MERANVEPGSQLGLGALPQLGDLQLANFVGQRLAGDGGETLDLELRLVMESPV